jgi:putative SOS response-associated peptidase YedK
MARSYSWGMCGRYNVHDDPWLQTLLRELGVDARLPARSNIAPTEPVPVVVDIDGRRELHEMRWWLVPSWAPEVSSQYSMFNAKSETLATSKAFRGPLRHRRCILPASSFIEWTAGNGKRQPWLIRPVGGAIAFAGLWDVWDRDGGHLESCTILTTRAAPGIDRLHGRMPVMLRAEDFDAWLDVREGRPDLQRIAAPRLPADFEIAPLTTDVNNARHKSDALMTPIGPAERVPAREE